jgi:hypothetical protein
MQSLDVSTKYGMAATPSWYPATGGGDKEDANAASDDEGRGRWQA